MKLKIFFSLCAFLLFSGMIAGPVLAQQDKEKSSINFVPSRQEQFVYSFNVFNGKGWSGGFCPQSENTIYFIANKDNALSARKTLVYFWPITGKYRAAWETLNEDVQGTLEILKNERMVKKLEEKDTVLCYPEGYWSEENSLYTGEEAKKWFQKYKKAQDEYEKALNKYYEAKAEYGKKMDKFFEEVKKRREAGEKGSLNIKVPQKPEPPEGPEVYVTKPEKKYVINLPAGKYKIRLRVKDGTIVEGSERNLLVFTARRKGGIGYEIIPGNRWTKREECNDPAKVIYAAGKNLLYFLPYQQNEYNQLYYNKLLDPQNEGRKDSWRWVHTKPIKDVFLLFFGGEKLLERVENKPYKVKQVSGPNLGYNIVEFTREEYPRGKPTFEGYRLGLSQELSSPQGYRIYLQKKEENDIISGSKREIRLVRKGNAHFLYYLSIFPLVIGGVVFAIRRRKVKK